MSTFPSCSQMPVEFFRPQCNTLLRLLYLLNNFRAEQSFQQSDRLRDSLYDVTSFSIQNRRLGENCPVNRSFKNF